MTRLTGYRVTLKCDDCAAHRRSYLIGRDGDDADGALAAISFGWEHVHAGHQQIVVVSPVTLDAEIGS